MLAEALAFALACHGEQTRKGGAIPYASHLLQVAGLVLEHGGDLSQAAVGLLHDTLEDCEGVSEAEIRARFGEEVARMVAACSDLLEGDRPDRKAPWRERKERHLEHLARMDRRLQLVVGCDKLHNLRSLLADLESEGLSALERFTAVPRQTRWYYEAVRAAIGAGLPERLRREMDQLLERLRGFIAEASPEP